MREVYKNLRSKDDLAFRNGDFGTCSTSGNSGKDIFVFGCSELKLALNPTTQPVPIKT